VNIERRMPLPFDLPAISRGYAVLTPSARDVGRRAALAAAHSIGALAGSDVSVTGRALPCVPAPFAGAARLRVELTALPGTAAVEVEAQLAIALLDRLTGGTGAGEPASSVTPLERSALELAALAALDGIASLADVETRLAPRLSRPACEPLAGLAVDLSIAIGACVGRARLILPPAALTALGASDPPSLSGAAVGLELSLRGGSAPLMPEELAPLAVGDVVLFDPPPPGRLIAVAPGGLRVVGAASDDGLLVEEIQMPDSSMEWPIALEVELARVPVTLGELARLEPGSILPLPIDRRGTVALKLGDRTIGRGQLVDVEGAVGVRIDSLAEGGR
jgi:type III secretion protein Q